MKKITIKDIAKVLGYSVSTVSKALTDSHEIGEITKSRIKTFAEKQGYQSNQYAKLLRKGRTNIIGIIVPSIGNSFFSQILEGIEQEMAVTDYNLIIMQSGDDPILELRQLETLFKKDADAVVIAPTGNNKSISYLKKFMDVHKPVVVIDRTNCNIHTHKIGIDNFKAVYQGISHLINSGKKNILFISTLAAGAAQERRQGYIQCLHDFNLIYNSDQMLSIEARTDKQTIYLQLRLYLEQQMLSKTPPDAIFTASDQITYQTLEVLQTMGIHIPAQIALIGFANFQYSNIFRPGLSSIIQPAKEIGSQAFLILNKALSKSSDADDCQFNNINLQVSIQIRQSSTTC